MTAEDFLNYVTSMDSPDAIGLPYKDIEHLMISFAKYHVKMALESIDIDKISNDVSILECYPLENIK